MHVVIMFLDEDFPVKLPLSLRACDFLGGMPADPPSNTQARASSKKLVDHHSFKSRL